MKTFDGFPIEELDLDVCRKLFDFAVDRKLDGYLYINNFCKKSTFLDVYSGCEPGNDADQSVCRSLLEEICENEIRLAIESGL